jgi:hypothetical protein
VSRGEQLGSRIDVLVAERLDPQHPAATIA